MDVLDVIRKSVGDLKKNIVRYHFNKPLSFNNRLYKA